MNVKRAILLATVLTSRPDPLLANEAATEDQYMDMSVEDLLRVTVSSASLFPESQMQAAATVQKISAKQWTLWGVRENHEAYSSNVAALETYSTLFGGHAIAIRGYAQFLSVRGVATLLDGVPLNDPIFGSALYDNEHVSLGVLDSIEVTRGPGSTLYGTDAFHGTIALRSFESDENVLAVNAQMGTPEYSALSAQASRVFAKQAILNVAVDGRQQEADEPMFAWKKNSLLMKLHSAASEDLVYEVSALSNGYEATDAQGGGRKFGHKDEDVSAGNHRFMLGHGDLEAKAGPGRVGLKLSRWDLTRDNAFEIASGNFAQLQVIDRSQTEAHWVMENEELRLYSGIEYCEEHVRRSEQNDNKQAEQGFSRTIRSAFGQGRWKKTGLDALQVEFGLRSDDYSDFGRQSSPRLAAIYNTSSTQVLKAIYSNAFRAAVTLEQYGSTTIKGSPNIRPEQLDSYELVWIDGHRNWSYQITGFSNLWKNGIIAVPLAGDPAYTAEFSNSGKNTSQGLEGEARFKWRAWMLSTQLTSTKSVNHNNHSTYAAFPKFTANTQLEARITDQQNLETRWQVKQQWKDGTGTAAEHLDPYQRWDLAWVWHGDANRMLALSVINLFNRDNRMPSLLDNSGGDPDQKRSLNASLGWTL